MELKYPIDFDKLNKIKYENAEVFLYLLSSIFFASLIISNIVASKLFILLKNPLSCGMIFYPITFFIVNIIGEIYGKHKALSLIKNGLIIKLFLISIFYLASLLPIYDESPVNEKAFSQIFAIIPKFSFIYILIYLLTQFLNLRLFNSFKKIAPNSLWIRTFFSPLIGQILSIIVLISLKIFWAKFFSTSIFNLIKPTLFYQIIFSQLIFGNILVILLTPLFYLIFFLKNKYLSIK